MLSFFLYFHTTHSLHVSEQNLHFVKIKTLSEVQIYSHIKMPEVNLI